VLATRGILGFISFLTILLIVFRRLITHLRRTGELKAHPIVRGAFYAFLFICFSSLFENHFADEEIFNFCSLVIGLGLAYAEGDADQSVDS
jgi:O-antigen ligase